VLRNATAAIAVLTVTGLAALYNGLPAAQPSPDPAGEARAETGEETPGDTPVIASAGVAPSPPPVRSPEPPPAVDTTIRAPAATSPPPLQTPPPPVAELASFHVSHQHRLGNCRGRLIVSRDGVAFVPDEVTANDAFALKHTEFLHTLADGTLSIKSATRTYRFKALAANGTDERGDGLDDVVNRIDRARRE
jgi:hypothetical protein